MPRRKRKRNMDNQTQPSFSGIPFDELRDLGKVHPEIILRVHRKNAKGAPQFVTKYEAMAIGDIADIEERIKNSYGGGEYLFTVANPLDQMDALKKFRLHIEGPPIAVAQGNANESTAHFSGAASAPTGVAPNGQAFGPAFRGHPQYQQFMGYPPGYVGTPNNPPVGEHPPLWSMASDQMALKMNSDLKIQMNKAEQEKLRLNEKIAADQEKAAAERNALLKRIEDTERQRVEDMRRAEADKNTSALAALERRLIDISNAKPEPKTPEWISMLPALVPIAVAMIESGKANAAAQLQAQQHQQTQMMQMMMAMNKKEDQSPLLAAIMPMLIKSMDHNSPLSKAEAMSTIMDQQMGSLQMIGDMMKSMQGEEPSPMLQLAQQALAGLGGVMEAMRANRQAEPTTPRLVANGQVYGLPAAQAVTTPPMPTTTTQINFDGMTPDTIVELIFSAPQMPAEMKTDAWRKILLSMHAQDPIEKLSQSFWILLSQLDKNKALPAIFANLDGNYEQVLPMLIAEMPIATINQEYAQALAGKLVSDYAGFLANRTNNAQPPVVTEQKPLVTAAPTEVLESDESDDEDDVDEDGDEEEEIIETTATEVSKNGKSAPVAQAKR